MSISTASLPTGTEDETYSATLGATGGDGTYSWSATGLPADGLSISSAGIIGGTPEEPETFSVTVTAKDAHGDTASKTYSITVSRPIIG
jgi:hypothetical protein